MKKVIFLLLCISAYVIWGSPLPVDHSGKTTANVAPSSPLNIQTSAKNLVFDLLPKQANWPRPLKILWQASHIKATARAAIPSNNWVALKDIPQTLQQGLIAVEDRRFYEHYGVDMDGIIRALLVNIQADSIVQGGSTLTQQLVKNTLLDSEQSMERKIFEAFLALWIEAQNSKEDILEIYLNTTYFGAGATGIKEAANIYFDVKPSQLTLAESATLAGLPNAPSALNPFENPVGCKSRRDLVLDLMVKYGYTTLTEAKTAINTPIILNNNIP